jgi:uncharacterized protein YndB with AHSA1/START domain
LKRSAPAEPGRDPSSFVRGPAGAAADIMVRRRSGAMAHKFEIAKDMVVDASREQVWEAIATGPGMDAWYMGRNEVEPREGGAVRRGIGASPDGSTVTVWEPPSRFAHTGTEAPDGSIHRFEFEISEDGDGSAIRYVHSGMLGGDLGAEYDAMSEGDPMYLDKLVQYLTYFDGRFATPIDVRGPIVADREHALTQFRRALGLDDEINKGDPVRLDPKGLQPIDGVVDYTSPSFIGVRTSDALYRFIYGFDQTVMVGHHLFSDGVDQQQAERGWQSWLSDLFEPSAEGGGATG